MALAALLAILAFSHAGHALRVDCEYYAPRNLLSCQCLDFNTAGVEDLSEIINGAVYDSYVNPYFRHVELTDCRRLDISLDLRAFVIAGNVMNLTDVSFVAVDELYLEFDNIDYGQKRFVFEDVKFLQLSGELEHPSTQVRFFIRNPGLVQYVGQKSDVVFQNFYAYSQITLINIQDARSVRVYDSEFDNLLEAELISVDRCHTDLYSTEEVDCNDWEELFATSSLEAFRQVVSHPVFITVVALVIILLLLVLLALVYVKRWKKRKELELLGFPSASAHAQSTLSTRGSSQLNGPNGNALPKGRQPVDEIREPRDVAPSEPDEVDHYRVRGGLTTQPSVHHTEVVHVHHHTNGRRNNAYEHDELERRYDKY